MRAALFPHQNDSIQDQSHIGPQGTYLQFKGSLTTKFWGCLKLLEQRRASGIFSYMISPFEALVTLITDEGLKGT